MEEKQDRGQKRGRVLDRLIQQRERRVAKDTAHRDMLVREGIIRLVPPFEEIVVIDTVRLRKINGRADWKWRAAIAGIRFSSHSAASCSRRAM